MQPPQISPAIVISRPALDVRPGSMIADKYRVERELGRGGFGVVVRAIHLALDQRVAIKVLTDAGGTPAEQAEDAERFRREAQATAALRSEHVVRILDVDTLASGAPYIVMEYLEGATLHQTTHTRGPLPLSEAVDYILQVLAALAEAHAAGIVHRDLKPANVFLARGRGGGSGPPVVKVLDFGVSKIGSGPARTLTRTGAMIGTVAYMAPEQMLDAKRVDGRADLWSVGQLLFESLTRRLPFGPMTHGTIVTAILTHPPIPLSALRPDLPREVEAIILRCLEKEPARRFQSAVELGIALEPFASPQSRLALDSLRRAAPPAFAAAAVARHPSRPQIAPPPPPRPAASSVVPLAIAGALGVITLLLVALAIVLKQQQQQPSPAPHATARSSGVEAMPVLSTDQRR